MESLGPEFGLPTCPRFFNIFHPYDPVAYRIESLVNPELAELRPFLIPHHKGIKCHAYRYRHFFNHRYGSGLCQSAYSMNVFFFLLPVPTGKLYRY
jgi:hypothetical protein